MQAPLAMAQPVALTAYAEELIEQQPISEAYISSISIDDDYGLELNFTAYGRYAKVYLNDQLVTTVYAEDNDADYDEEGNYIHVNESFSGSYYAGNVIYSKKYNFKVVAYDMNDVASQESVKTYEKAWPKVNSIDLYTTTSYGNSLNHHTGYGMRGIQYTGRIL